MNDILKYPAFLILCLFLGTNVQAQTFFEGTGGQTSLYLPVGGITRINTTANSLKIGYYYNRSDKDIVLGVDASGISNNGFAPLVTSKELSPEANLSFNVGFKNVSTGDEDLSRYDYLNIRFGIGAARYTLIDTDASFEQQISSESFNKINAGISYNYYLNGNMIFGGYAGYDRTNNIPSLNRLTIKETATTATSPGGVTRTVESEYTAWQGSLEAVNQFSLFFDYVYLPDFLHNRLALSLYTRSSFNSIRDITNGGLGLYLNRDGEPLKVVGGLIYEFQDLFDARNSNISLGERGTLGIVVGYNF